MKMKLTVPALFGLALALGSGVAAAQLADPYGVVDITKVSVPGVDKDGDGCLDKTEVTPGSQLDKRFATRDTNGDGKLCKDEYFAP